MSEHYITVAGVAASKLTLTVPHGGAWYADVWIPTDDAVDGAVEIQVGDTTLQGTVETSGVYGHRRRVLIRAGGGGWGKVVSELAYHSDSGVQALTVARDAAASAGETLDESDFTPDQTRLGVDFVRVRGVASKTLDTLGFWWVDYAGGTHIGSRAESATDPEKVQELDYDPSSGRLALHVDDLGDVIPGMSVLVDGEPLTVRALQVDATEDGIKVAGWVRPAAERDRFGDLIRAIAARATDAKLPYSYEYKVVSMAADRVNLKPADTAAGLPELSATSIWTAPGVSAQLVAGAAVAVSFLDGNPAKPFVHACTPPDKSGHTPARLDLGAPNGIAVARVGDTVNVLFPPAVPVSGTLAGAPFVGTMMLTTAATGVIQGGSGKVFSQ